MELILRSFNGALSRLRRIWLQARGVQISGPVWLRRISIPRHPHCISLERGVALDDGVVLLAAEPSAKIFLRAGCYVNRHAILDCSELLEIGPGAMIGPFCYLTDHDHSVDPATGPGKGPLISRPTTIGANCWLGAHVTVLKGVTVGDGAVVGAGSIVTKSLPPGAIAVGNPARILRQLPVP